MSEPVSDPKSNSSGAGVGRRIEMLRRYLREGGFRLGELWVSPEGELTHHHDVDEEGLVAYFDPYAALEIARYDEAGKMRPLKSAPNLKRGWKLVLPEPSDILLALDFIYPAALALVKAWEDERLKPVDLRRTLDRQSGMYAVVRKLSDSQALGLVSTVCRGQPGCQRRILWNVSADCRIPEQQQGVRAPEARTIPLLCAEPCNLLVAAGRKVLKGDKA